MGGGGAKFLVYLEAQSAHVCARVPLCATPVRTNSLGRAPVRHPLAGTGPYGTDPCATRWLARWPVGKRARRIPRRHGYAAAAQQQWSSACTSWLSVMMRTKSSDGGGLNPITFAAPTTQRCPGQSRRVASCTP